MRRVDGMALEPHDLAFFASPAELRAWLVEHHATETELWIGRYKKGTGKASVTWPEIVDQVLCFGWIDGQGKRIDDEVFAQRITPRKLGSIWSAVNIAKVAALTEAGLMEPAGLAAFAETARGPIGDLLPRAGGACRSQPRAGGRVEGNAGSLGVLGAIGAELSPGCNPLGQASQEGGNAGEAARQPGLLLRRERARPATALVRVPGETSCGTGTHCWVSEPGGCRC